MDNSKKNLDQMEKKIEEKLSHLESSVLDKVQKVTTRRAVGGIKDSSSCYAACPQCITRCCTLILGHYCQHQCSEGHMF